MLIAKQASFLELPNESKSNQKHPPYHEQLARANKDVADIDAGETSTLSMLWHKVMRHTPAGDKSVVDHW